MTALLEINNLEAGYGTSQVLEGVSFSMGVEATVIIGRNGMGKTTLCNTIMGLVEPRAGSISLDGTNTVSYTHLTLPTIYSV